MQLTLDNTELTYSLDSINAFTWDNLHTHKVAGYFQNRYSVKKKHKEVEEELDYDEELSILLLMGL